MRLYLLRHAEAADLFPDSERPLTTRGRQDSAALGRHLARQGVELPDEVWTSPYRRARETAEHLLEAAGVKRAPLVRDGWTPEDDPAVPLAELERRTGDLLVVGHNPHLAILAGLLLGGEAAVQVRKCTLLRFTRTGRVGIPGSRPGWVLEWMLAPKLFRA